MRLAISTALLCLLLAAPAEGQGGPHAVEPGEGRSFARAAGSVVAANVFVWAANRYVKDEATARVGTRSWGGNLGSRLVWDPDGFANNQFGHPYHGGLYFAAGRANGFGYWGSMPFAAGGSLLWEYFGETTRPSANDLVNTTMGGIALGEVAHRLSGRIGRGGGAARRVAAAAVSPARGLPGLLGAGGAAATPGESPGPISARVALGYLRQRTALGGLEDAGAFVELRAAERSAFDPEARRPFDAYRFEIEAAPGTEAVVTRARVSGLLARGWLGRAAGREVVVGLFHEYDYLNLGEFVLGSQGVGAGMLHRRQWGATAELRLDARLRGIALAGAASNRALARGRGYDYGSGVGTSVSLAWARGGRDLVRLEHGLLWLRTHSGTYPAHRASVARAELEWPVRGPFGMGADFALRTHSAGAVRDRVPRMRVFLLGPAAW